MPDDRELMPAATWSVYRGAMDVAREIACQHGDPDEPIKLTYGQYSNAIATVSRLYSNKHIADVTYDTSGEISNEESAHAFARIHVGDAARDLKKKLIKFFPDTELAGMDEYAIAQRAADQLHFRQTTPRTLTEEE